MLCIFFITLWELPCGWGFPQACTVRTSVRLGLWNFALVLYDGFGGVEEGWHIQYAWCFFRGLRFCGAWSQGGVWTTFSPLAMCPVSQRSTSTMSLQPSPSRAAKKMACKRTGNTRQPCLWVQCVIQCCLHWTDWCLLNWHLSVLPEASVLAGLEKTQISPVKVLNVLKGPYCVLYRAVQFVVIKPRISVFEPRVPLGVSNGLLWQFSIYGERKKVSVEHN